MTIYGGFEPGTFQAWALNLAQSVFGTAGIARGMQVQPTSPAGLSVQVSIDATALDGVCYLPNGGWLRIDAVQQLSVPSNSSGVTRNDAVVATMDPTQTGSASLAYVTNWAGGFAGGTNNQFVLATVSVPNGAATITSGNITQNTAAANAGTAGNAGYASSAGYAGGLSSGALISATPASAGLGMLVGFTASGQVFGLIPVTPGVAAAGVNIYVLNNSDIPTVAVRCNTDSSVALDAGTITTNGGGTLSLTSGHANAGLLVLTNTQTTGWGLTLSNTLTASNKLMDLQQGYGVYSDNVATIFAGGTTRFWVDAPNNGEMHFGGRTSANVLAGVRFRTHQLMFDDNVIQAGLLVSPSQATLVRCFVQGTTPTGTVNDGDLWFQG